jgi:hypothetical protein
MSIANILKELDAEIARLERARTLLSKGSNLNLASLKASGRIGHRAAQDGYAAPKTATRKKRVLSPEARQRIADAQRKRWAAQKRAAK